MDRSVLVVGAGMAGISAALLLEGAGIEVTVVDKSRAVGGRMATRRLGDATFDHGVQSFSVTTEPFQRDVARLISTGIARSRPADPIVETRGHAQDVVEGVGGMRRIPERLAEGLRVRSGVGVDRLVVDDRTVTLFADGISIATADAAILTPPLPQTSRLLDASGLGDVGLVEKLADVRYESTLAVMAALDSPADLGQTHLSFEDGPLAFIGDNQEKGVSATPALTIHSSAAFADRHLGSEPAEWEQVLLEAAFPHHQGVVTQSRAHRWRYSRLKEPHGACPLMVGSRAPVVLAGEAFGGGTVEGAYTSGLAAAGMLIDAFA